MLFGVPPPNQDPQYEAEYVKRTPRERLEGVIYGLGVVTLLLVVAAVVMRLL
jgi:hypothetical protein